MIFILLPFAALTSTEAGSSVAVGTSLRGMLLWSHPVSSKHLCSWLRISTSIYVSGMAVRWVTVFSFIPAEVGGAAVAEAVGPWAWW